MQVSSWLRQDIPPSSVSHIDTDSNLLLKRPVYVRGSMLVSTCVMIRGEHDSEYGACSLLGRYAEWPGR
jgi:hypothetical protein